MTICRNRMIIQHMVNCFRSFLRHVINVICRHADFDAQWFLQFPLEKELSICMCCIVLKPSGTSV